MTALASSMELVFIVCWFVAVAGWFYGARYFLPMWAAGFKGGERHRGYTKKTLIGLGIFLSAFVIGGAAGLVAEYWGGGWGP